MLEIQLFGVGRASLDGVQVTGFPNQQAAQLLCYLLLNRSRPQPRERLAAVFWGQHSSSTARKYLRNALWRLGQLVSGTKADIQDYLNITETSIGFQPQTEYWLDIEAFERDTTGCKSTAGSKLTAEQAQGLETAVALYQGDLLESIYEDWTLYERERLRLLYIGSLNKLMIYHGTHQRPEQGLVHGENILAMDPAREKIHRQMMWLYWLQGDRSAALAQYNRCKQILREELGIPPMRETHNLYTAIKQNAEAPQTWNDDALESSGTLQVSQDALQKLRSLQKLADRIHAELRTLEGLLNQKPAD
jgi:DNA-binding SARP family transcriptional activator